MGCGCVWGMDSSARVILPVPRSGQRYLSKVLQLLGPLARNYYIRAFLHLG